MWRERKSSLLQILIKIQLVKRKKKKVKSGQRFGLVLLLNKPLILITADSLQNLAMGQSLYLHCQVCETKKQSSDLMVSFIFTHLCIHFSYLNPKARNKQNGFGKRGHQIGREKRTPQNLHSRYIIACSSEQFAMSWWFCFMHCNPPSLQLYSDAQPFLPTRYYASCGRHEDIAKSLLSCQTTGSSSCQFCSASEKLEDLCWASFKLK